MNVEKLDPPPDNKKPFRRSHQKFVPDRAGCYVLTTFADVVLYVGLAVDLRRRMGEHLDSPGKIEETAIGRAIWFHWREDDQLNRLERTWMNIHIQSEGRLPVLNGVYSPTST